MKKSMVVAALATLAGCAMVPPHQYKPISDRAPDMPMDQARKTCTAQALKAYPVPNLVNTNEQVLDPRLQLDGETLMYQYDYLVDWHFDERRVVYTHCLEQVGWSRR